MNPNDILAQNRESWDAIADTFFGVTALPEYGCFIPSEEELRLFPALAGQKVLDKTTPRLIQFHTLKNAVNPPFLGGFSIFNTVVA